MGFSAYNLLSPLQIFLDLNSVVDNIYFHFGLDCNGSFVLELRIKILFYTIGYRQNIMDNNVVVWQRRGTNFAEPPFKVFSAVHEIHH